ncbi:DUF2807 domain-containing protein [Chitinophaga sp. Mgbs1]|uniref:DUF2807 domain-containing protein n=1 Tax=Chitinophaga solisilvae TaxID=1233460 RepID=A0A433WJU9_9BACT|nr:DUF2807 domain-containing protein [Chitinophaga solisilvae]
MKKQFIITYTSLSVSWLLLMITIFSLILSSCTKDRISGSGNVVAEKRSISPFTDVEINGPFEVHLLQDSTGVVEIKAEDNIIGVIETGTSSNTLFVRVKSSVNLRRHLPIHIYVHSRIFQRVQFWGSGSLDNKDTIQSAIFTYQNNGSGDAALVLDARDLKTVVSGSGNLHMKGHAVSLNSEIKGSGDIDGLGMEVNNAEISIRGSGDHSIRVKSELRVGIYGSGDVTYAGNPGLVETEVKGSGKINKI